MTDRERQRKREAKKERGKERERRRKREAKKERGYKESIQNWQAIAVASKKLL